MEPMAERLHGFITCPCCGYSFPITEENEEYEKFVEKSRPKLTTDDCFTPPNVYDVVAEWVEEEYQVKRKNFVRPFKPGGDYQKEEYKKNDIVVDNPPFSILAEILRYYTEAGVKYFLFCPALVAFSSSSSSSSVICTGVGVIYENGANVNTSFVTNLEPEDIRARTAPELYQRIKEQVEKDKKEKTREVAKLSYPNELITAAMLNKLSRYGQDLKFTRAETAHVRELDNADGTIYGAGYLISREKAAEKAAAEKATAEKAAAQKIELSEREKEIVRNLSSGKTENKRNKNR